MHSKQKDMQAVAKFVRTKKSNRAGWTLVETMVAIAILIIGLMGISSMYVSAGREILKQRIYQTAIHLAAQKIEEARAIGYLNIKVDEEEEEEELSLLWYTCQRNTQVEFTAEPELLLPMPCKKMTVSVQWAGLVGEQHEVKLATYIGP